ncbi:hypothetical protein [Brevibacillus brevis]|uniref:hypothetical protein n=1 Tax=Brevibacillus brevis TaxID=1393 RepID=UPI000D0FAB34|nr:hypothetical protein [Brevibacillus brevis]PSJ67364.1 hypothetical protein C7J99_20420 [Brevibacillus brevis]RED28338.1 hypothetical protein DES34_108203 [Brevibacillus brevis]GEC93790.1 hypothetical protein BBR01nite_61210 [Brevibacillus brevis]VEF91033.1 Uncharacterised protein [Brevibacillus brevis]
MKKGLARITALSTVLGVLALSTSIAIAAENNVAPLGTADDYEITLYKSNIHDVTDTSAYLWSYTEGAGKDLEKVRVYSYFYVNGNLKHQAGDNDAEYASVDYEANVTALMKARITSSHYAYNRVGEKVTETSEREWPK